MRQTVTMIVALLLLLGSFFLGRRTAPQGADNGRVDTLIVYRTKAADNPVYSRSEVIGTIAVPTIRWACFTDTLTQETERVVAVHDTIYLEREQRYYSELDGRLRMWVSGYEPSLDRWELDEREITITRTPRRPRWSVSIGAGYGAGKEGLTPFVGATIGYNIISF